MKESLRDRFGFWLEQFHLPRRLLFRYDGQFGDRARYINRINGHVVIEP